MAALLRIAAEASTSGGLLSSLRALPARTAWEHSQAASVRYFRGGSAALFAKAKAKGAKVAPEAPEVGMSATHCTGLNYTKGVNPNKPSTLDPKPYTLHTTHYTLHLTHVNHPSQRRCTLNVKRLTLEPSNHTPYEISNPTPHTLDLKSYVLNPKPHEILNPKP